ncbi:MAG: OmpA family protein [Deltaproteobacteria bacterium]|nr:OmpA family protein [Deltaproteobacteria bacterium]
MENHDVKAFRLAAYAAALWIGLGSSPAFAQEQNPADLQGWFELDTFRMPSTSADGIGMERAAVLGAWEPSVDAAMQFDQNPLTMQRKNGGSYHEAAQVSSRLFVAHIAAALGFFDYAQLGVQLPAYLDKGRPKSSGGLGDMRLVPKGAYRFDLGGGRSVGLALLIPIGIPTGDPKTFTGNGQATAEPRLVVDAALGRFGLALDGGFLVRDEKTRYGLVRGPELLLALGGEYQLSDVPGKFRLLAEVSMRTQTADAFSRASTPATILGGVRYRFDVGLVLGLAFGAGVSPGVGAPDFRIVAGIGFVAGALASPDEGPRTQAPPPPDRDGDGVPDAEDFCPDSPEDYDKFDDEDGCPDLDNDGDGIPDRLDRCPTVAEDKDGMEDDDGCPESDRDGDGISDRKDNCPNEAEDKDGFDDTDGCPDPDNDEDGVLDVDDKCPNVPESPNGVDDQDGCPELLAVDGDTMTPKKPIRFEPRTARLAESSFAALEEVASVIVAKPSWREVRIRVHTSGLGRAGDDQVLSEERAVAILHFLVAAGVVPDRLVAVGIGDQEPLARPDEKDAAKRNERVEFVAVEGKP